MKNETNQQSPEQKNIYSPKNLLSKSASHINLPKRDYEENLGSVKSTRIPRPNSAPPIDKPTMYAIQWAN